MLVHLRQEQVTPEKAPKRLCKENITYKNTLQYGQESVDFVVKDVLGLLLDAVEQKFTPTDTIVQSNILGKTSVISEIETELIRDNAIFDENIEFGEKISDILTRGKISEESLSKKNKYCLELFRKYRGIISVRDAVLKPWQKNLMRAIDEPHFRAVVWIIGTCGNEGKTWFQNYVESLYGYERVARLDFKSRTQDVLHALSKRPLASTDIFLFNIPRSTDAPSSCYNVLESIKDGVAISSKYDSKPIRFKTPNVLIVFSNEPPETKQLSKDRWCIKAIKPSKGTLVSISPNMIYYNQKTGKYCIKNTSCDE